jgi:hypothetical protein
MIIGSILSVDTTYLGTTLVSDAELGDTQLIVSDVFDFDESGGILLLDVGSENEEDNPILNYIGVVENNGLLDGLSPLSTILLDPATPVPVDLLDIGIENVVNVYIHPRGVETIATVFIDDNDNTEIGAESLGDPETDLFTVRLSHSVAALIPDGVRTDETGYENVIIEQEGDEWVVVDVLGNPATIDGSNIDPNSTIPYEALTDGVPPTVAPVVVAKPFAIGAVQADWEPIVNADPVSYRVYASLNPVVPLDSTGYVETTTGTHTSFNNIVGSLLPTDVPVYIVVVPFDADGDGPASVVVSTNAKKVSAGDINNNAITPASMSPDALVKNLTYNGSFEDIDSTTSFPVGWVQTSSWSSCVSSTDFSAFGGKSIKFSAVSAAWSNSKLIQTPQYKTRVDRSSQQSIVAGISHRVSTGSTTSGLTLRLVWLDSNDVGMTQTVGITSYSVVSNSVTFVTDVRHGLVQGDSVTISGVDVSVNGTYLVGSSVSDNQFNVQKTTPNTPTTAVDGTATFELFTNVPNIYRKPSTDVWSRVSGRVSIPENAASFLVCVRYGDISGSTPSLYIDNVTTDFVLSSAYIEANSIGAEEISANYVYAGSIESNQISGNNIFGKFAQIDKLTTGDSNPNITIDSGGIVATNSSGGVKFNLPTDPSIISTFSGVASLDSVTIQDKLTLSGHNNEIQRDSNLMLGYAISAPKTEPTLVVEYPNKNIEGGGTPTEYGYKKHSDGYWYSVLPFFGTYEILQYTQDVDGNLTNRTAMFNSESNASVSKTFYPTDTLEYGGDIYVLGIDTSLENSYYTKWMVIHKIDKTSWTYGGRIRVDIKDYSDVAGAFTAIGSTVYICRHRSVNNNWVISKFTMPTTFNSQVITVTRDALDNNNFNVRDDALSIQAVTDGNFLGSGSNPRWAVVRRNAPYVYSFDRNGTLLQKTNEQFTTPASGEIHGTFWDGSQWVAWGQGNLWWLPNTNRWSGHPNTKKKWWVCYSWYDNVGTQHESKVSKPSSIDVPKYASVRVTTQPIPPDNGTDYAVTGVRIYMKYDSNTLPAESTFYRDSVDLPSGTTTKILTGQLSGSQTPYTINPTTPSPPTFICG